MINQHTISFPFDETDLQRRIAYDANNRPQYIGRARPGALTSAAEWQIRKFDYDSDSERVVSITFAAGVNDYNNVWDDRAALSYS